MAKKGGVGLFKEDRCFSRGTNFVGKIYRRIVSRGVTYDQIIPREKESWWNTHFKIKL